jgi:diaminopropionate ammonia-lyase
VAWASRLVGCDSVVFIADACSTSREMAIVNEGARVVRVRGTYEDAHQAAINAVSSKGWVLISDTAFAGYTSIPVAIMTAYQLVMREVLDQLPSADRLTHVFVQAGTGGFAAATCLFLWQQLGTFRPVLTVVEADVAACLFRSASESRLISVSGPHQTIMAGLACGEASTVAWDVLSCGADAFATVQDVDARTALAALGNSDRLDGLITLPSATAVAGLAAFQSLSRQSDLRTQIGLGPSSRVLVFGTEGLVRGR